MPCLPVHGVQQAPEEEPVDAGTKISTPSVLPVHDVQQMPKEVAVDTGLNVQLEKLQQSMGQLLQMVSDQGAEQQVLKSEISHLKFEITRIQSPATVQPFWIAEMESILAAYFDRQEKQLDEMNSPAKTQQVTTIGSKLFLFIGLICKIIRFRL